MINNKRHIKLLQMLCICMDLSTTSDFYANSCFGVKYQHIDIKNALVMVL